MIKKILLVLLVLLVAFVVVVMMQPATFRITRTAVVNAPPATVFPYANNLHKWQEWSPWAKIDPNCKVTFEGPQEGPGAIFRWDGNNEVGAGSMTITETKPDELVRIDLVFLKPFAGKSVTDFGFKPEGPGTRVTWTMSGTNDFIGKAMGLIMNCDKMVGGQFEKGLDSLKAIVEPQAKK